MSERHISEPATVSLFELKKKTSKKIPPPKKKKQMIENHLQDLGWKHHKFGGVYLVAKMVVIVTIVIVSWVIEKPI